MKFFYKCPPPPPGQYNSSCQKGCLPTQWKKATVTLIPKSGGSLYRPISLLQNILWDQGNRLRLLENTINTITFIFNVIDYDYIIK